MGMLTDRSLTVVRFIMSTTYLGDDGTEVIDSELGARNPAPALADSTISIRGLRKSFPGSWFSG